MSHAYIEVTNIDANNYTVQYYLLPLATVKIMYFVLYNNALTLEVPCVRTGRTYAEVVLGFLTFHCSPQPVLKWCSYLAFLIPYTVSGRKIQNWHLKIQFVTSILILYVQVHTYLAFLLSKNVWVQKALCQRS